jgi:hypothetical protein
VKTPEAAPRQKTPEPEVQKPAEQRPEPGKKAEQAPDGKHECRRYIAISNMTISVPCPD